MGLLVAVAIFAAACGSAAVPDTAEPTPTPANTATPTPTATPVPTITLPTPQPESQEAVFGAVARWILNGHREELSPVTYVLESTETGSWFDPEHTPELASGGPSLWGATLTAGSHDVIEAILGPIVDLEFVVDPEDVVDPDGYEIMGCRAFLSSSRMVVLRAPFHVGERIIVEVQLNSGCQGDQYLLEVELSGASFEVMRIIQQGYWIV